MQVLRLIRRQRTGRGVRTLSSIRRRFGLRFIPAGVAPEKEAMDDAFLHCPMEFKPLGPPPEDRPGFALETVDEVVRTVRAVLTQSGALDVDAAPGHEPSGEEPIRVAGYKLTPAKPGTSWTMTPDECRLISDDLAGATDGDISAAQEALRGTHERGVLANPREVCESWAAFFDECAGLGGLSVTTLPSSIEDW